MWLVQHISHVSEVNPASEGLMTIVGGEHNTESLFEKDSKGGIFKRQPGSTTHTDMLFILAFLNVNFGSPTLK